MMIECHSIQLLIQRVQRHNKVPPPSCLGDCGLPRRTVLVQHVCNPSSLAYRTQSATVIATKRRHAWLHSASGACLIPQKARTRASCAAARHRAYEERVCRGVVAVTPSRRHPLAMGKKRRSAFWSEQEKASHTCMLQPATCRQVYLLGGFAASLAPAHRNLCANLLVCACIHGLCM